MPAVLVTGDKLLHRTRHLCI